MTGSDSPSDISRTMPGMPKTMPGLEALVTDLFDYSGLFPPAARTLDEALVESRSLPTTLRRPWLLATNFVAPLEVLPLVTADRLAKAEVPCDGSWKVSVFGGPWPPSGEEFRSHLRRCVDALNLLRDSKVELASFEIKCASFARGELERAIEQLHEALRDLVALKSPLRVGIELDFSSKVMPQMEELLRARREDLFVVPKVRCTGASAPAPDGMAELMEFVCEHGLPFKATAGLHHPFRDMSQHDDPYGFLTLVAALRLRQAVGADFGRDELVALLEAGPTSGLELTNGVEWRGKGVSAAKLAELRRASYFGIGSCSLSEPDLELMKVFGPP